MLCFPAASLLIVLLFQASQSPCLINHGDNSNILPIIICLQTFMIHAHSKPVFPLACIDKTWILPQGHSPGWLSPWSQWGSLGTTWIIKNEHRTLRSFQTTEMKKKNLVDMVLNPQKFVGKEDLRNAPHLFIFLLFQKENQINIFRFFFL